MTPEAVAVYEAVALVAGLQDDTVEPSMRLVEDLGLDSASLIEVLAILNVRGLPVEEDVFLEVTTVGELVQEVSDTGG